MCKTEFVTCRVCVSVCVSLMCACFPVGPIRSQGYLHPELTDNIIKVV